jgi:hypothetical protein
VSACDADKARFAELNLNFGVADAKTVLRTQSSGGLPGGDVELDTIDKEANRATGRFNRIGPSRRHREHAVGIGQVWVIEPKVALR